MIHDYDTTGPTAKNAASQPYKLKNLWFDFNNKKWMINKYW